MSSYSQNPTAFYLKLCTGYYDELINSGRRDMAAAFVEYCRDVDRGRVFKFQDYARYWFSDYSKKSKAHQWITKFNVAIEAFKKASEKTFVKNQVEPKLNQDTTVFEPDLNGSDASNTDRNDVLENQVEPKFNEDATVYEQELHISITSNNNKSIFKKREKEKEELALPDCIPARVWETWVNYRVDCKLTINNATLVAQALQLETWFNMGYEPADIIKNSIFQGWKGLFISQSTATSKALSDGREEKPWEKKKRLERERGEALQLEAQRLGYTNVADYLTSFDSEQSNDDFKNETNDGVQDDF